MRLFKPNVDKMLAKRDVEGLIKTLDDPEKQTRFAARDALIQIGVPALPELCAAVHYPQVNIRILASWAIGDIGEKASGTAQAQAMQTLLAALQDEDRVVRENAVVGLGQIHDPQSVEPLVAFFAAIPDNTDNRVWNEARIAIPKIGIPAVDPLLSLLKHQNIGARRGAAGMLGDIRDRRTVEPLISSMADEDFVVRQNSALALGKLCDPRAIQVLTLALKDRAMQVRRNASWSLGQLGNEQNAGPLYANLNHADPAERSVAHQAFFGLLERMTDKEEEKEVCEAAKTALMGFGQASLDTLTRALQDNEGEVRKQAARGLGILGVKQALPALEALDSDPDAGVREAAVSAKKALGWQPPPPPLATLAKEFEAVAQREGMKYVTSRHSRNMLIDQSELRQIVQSSGATALRNRYGLSDGQIRAVMDYIASGPHITPEDQKILDTLIQLCNAYTSNDTTTIARLEPEATHIGEVLDERGGIAEMRRIFELLGDRQGRRTLEMHWGGIGSWRG